MFDFAAVRPEINSTMMYLGPGSGPLLAAAAAWAALAEELSAAAQVLQFTVEGLAVSFLGASSLALVQSVSPYVQWLHINAELARLAAEQMTAAASAYEAAYAATVPPLVVLANRVQWGALILTNFFGQNTLAIGEKEAEYLEMWAQDAAAMIGYHTGALAAMSATVPFSPAPEMVSEAGLFQQALAAEESISQAAVNQTANQTMGASKVAMPPTSQQGTASTSAQQVPGPGTASVTAKPLWGGAAQHLSPMSNVVGMTNNGVSMLGQVASQTNTLSSMMKGFMPAATKAAETAANAMQDALGSMGRGGLGSNLGQVSAGLGRGAASVGALRVPEGWAAANQSVIPAARTLPLASSLAAAAEGGPRPMMGGLPMGPMASGMGGGVGTVNNVFKTPTRGFKMFQNLSGG